MKLGSLNYNARSEEGEVKWHVSVDLTKPDVVMLDILRDWIVTLTDAYEDLRKTTFPYDENSEESDA
jgi:hypothetical protein